MGQTALKRKCVTIYTDGACVGNPGPGGYGVVLLYGTRRKELSGGFRMTTNNRMELLAAIEGLRALKEPCAVTLYSDSRYVVDAMAKGWAERWRAEHWRKSKFEPCRERTNADLWKVLLELSAGHAVAFEWVKGHAGNVENVRCDALAVSAATQPDLPTDREFERALTGPLLAHTRNDVSGASPVERIAPAGESVVSSAAPANTSVGARLHRQGSEDRPAPAPATQRLDTRLKRQHGPVLGDVLTQLHRRQWQPIRWAMTKVYDRPGVYVLGLGVPTAQGACAVYVGSTLSLRTRLGQHTISFSKLPAGGFGPMYAMWAYCTSEQDARESESWLIRVLRPAWNGLGWGASPFWTEIPASVFERLRTAAGRARRASVRSNPSAPTRTAGDQDVLARLRVPMR